MQDPLKIIGAHGKRREMDFYPTPPEVTVALVRFLRERYLMTDADTVWEPACGDGAMVRALRSEGLTVTASDIQNGLTFSIPTLSWMGAGSLPTRRSLWPSSSSSAPRRYTAPLPCS